MNGSIRWCALLLMSALAACVSAPEAPVAAAHRRIALTFDDVPRARGAFLTEDERTTRLIAGLRAARVRQAAFFLNPGHIAQSPGAERRIAAYVAAGHVIANHSATHPHLNAISSAEYIADIDAAERWLKERDGYRPWFRFPYLDEGQRDKAKRDAVRKALAERGLANGYVTVDASDWHTEQAAIDAKAAGQAIDMAALHALYIERQVDAAEYYDGLAREALGRSPAHVLLLHETDLAALWIHDLVAALRARGWTIVTADEAFADPISHLHPDVPSAQGTLTEALEWERGLPAPRWYNGNDMQVAEAEFRRRVLHLDQAVRDVTIEGMGG